MLQDLESGLRKFHALFGGGRCDGWQLEELLVRAIQSDTQAQHNVYWQEGGHDDKADMQVRTNGETHPLQIKSGRIQGKRDPNLVLSGHRLTRFNGDFGDMTEYLNNRTANILSVPYEQINNERGRRHIYAVSYVDVERLRGLDADAWAIKGKSYFQTQPGRSCFVAYSEHELASMVAHPHPPNPQDAPDCHSLTKPPSPFPSP